MVRIHQRAPLTHSILTTRLRSLATAGLFAVLAFGIYATANPAPRSPAERDLLQQAAGVGSAETGLPLFFHVADEHWLQPVAVYGTALAGFITSPDNAGRLAAAATGGLNVALIFLISRRLYASTLVAVGASLLLLATPAHLAYARTGVDAIYPLPFVLVWLLTLAGYFETGDRRLAAAGAFALGVGVYSHPSAPLTMGALLAVTLVTISISGHRDWRSLWLPVAAFAAPVSVAAAWLAMNPVAYPDTFGRWAIHAAHLRSPWDGVRALVNWNTLGTRLSIYWGSFDPSWLFFDGPSLATPLGGAAPFLFATAIALAAGMAQRLRDEWSPVTVMLLAGVAVAPLAACTFGEPHAIGDFLALVPLVVTLAAGGVAGLLARDGWRRILGWAAIALFVIDAAQSMAAL